MGLLTIFPDPPRNNFLKTQLVLVNNIRVCMGSINVTVVCNEVTARIQFVVFNFISIFRTYIPGANSNIYPVTQCYTI